MGNANSGRYPKLTPEDRKRIIGLVADGMRVADVAREVARSTGFVHRVVAGAGGVARRLDWDPSPARLSAAEREEIRSGLDAGESFRAIAARLGRAPSTVSREVNANGGPSATGAGGPIVVPAIWLGDRRPPSWRGALVCGPRSRPGSARSCGHPRRSAPSCASSSPTIR